MSSDFVILEPNSDTTKEIKKILREKHPGYEKNSIDGEAFDSLCETISFYLTRGRIKKARASLNVMPFVPISLSEKEIENIIQECKKKDRYWQASHSFLLSTTIDLSYQKTYIIIDMRYDKNGLPVNEYYTEELIKPTIDKKKEPENQKYYIGASIFLTSIVLISLLCS